MDAKEADENKYVAALHGKNAVNDSNTLSSIRY
jgi:hypothetical protein